MSAIFNEVRLRSAIRQVQKKTSRKTHDYDVIIKLVILCISQVELCWAKGLLIVTVMYCLCQQASLEFSVSFTRCSS